MLSYPDTFSDHLRQAWGLYRTHWAKLLPIYLLLSVPSLLVETYGELPNVGSLDAFLPEGTSPANILSLVLAYLPNTFALIYTARVFLDSSERTRPEFKITLGQFLSVFSWAILNAVFWFGPLALVESPAAYLPLAILVFGGFVLLYFTLPVVVIEKRSLFSAMRQSAGLVKSQFFRVFGYSLVVSFGVLFLSFLVSTLDLPTLAANGLETAVVLYDQIFFALLYLSSTHRYAKERAKK